MHTGTHGIVYHNFHFNGRLSHELTLAGVLLVFVLSMLFLHLFIILPSNRHHRSNGDCLEGKRENYQVCSVQYCVQQLYGWLVGV